jgi:hypothetical protein
MQVDEHKEHIFEYRLDFYWQFISAYFVALLIYGVVKGSIDQGYITMKWTDPVVLLMLFFIVLASLFLAF